MEIENIANPEWTQLAFLWTKLKGKTTNVLEEILSIFVVPVPNWMFQKGWLVLITFELDGYALPSLEWNKMKK